MVARVEQSVPSLENQLADVDKFIEEGKTYQESPHIIDVILPFLCSYLPTWWQIGPDNADPQATGGHMTMVSNVTHLKYIQ